MATPGIRITGTQTAAADLDRLLDRLSGRQAKWVFSKMIDEIYDVQKRHWKEEFSRRGDKYPRKNNPTRFMFQSGGLFEASTTERAQGSFHQSGVDFAFVGLKGSAVGLAQIHRNRFREVIGEPTRMEEARIVDQLEHFLILGKLKVF